MKINVKRIKVMKFKVMKFKEPLTFILVLVSLVLVWFFIWSSDLPQQ